MKLNKIITVMCFGLYSCSPSNTYIARSTPVGYTVRVGDRSFFRTEDSFISITDFRDTQTLLHEHFRYIATIYPPSEEFKAECIRVANGETYINKRVWVMEASRRYIESTYNALSKGRVKLHHVHHDSYWDIEDNIWEEVYSNLLVIRATGRWSQILELEKDFPKVVGLFLEDVKYHGIK